MSTNRYSRPIFQKTQYGERLCVCGCGRIVDPPRIRYATNACRAAFRVRSNVHDLRAAVYSRDKGVCAACGRDTEALRRHCATLQGIQRTIYAKSKGIPRHRINKSWWDAHHIIEVVNGGGECELENLQTLCISCHAAETRELLRKI